MQKNRMNKKGYCPVRCRITYYKKRKEFSTGLFINPDYWDSRKQIASIPNDKNYLNNQLSLIKQKVNQAFLFLQVNEANYDVEDIYLQYKGKSIKTQKTILEVFELHNVKFLRLVGKEYTESTYKKFKEAKKHTANFIKHAYKRNDFILENITLKFIDDLDYYLKSEKNHKQITINKTIQRVRKIIKLAISERFISKDPFILYKPKRVVKNVVFLTVDELKLLEKYSFKQKRLQQVKDMFVFCCYTGLAYQEMSILTVKNIEIGFDGNEWIQLFRQKTKKNISIPLLPKAREVLDKYSCVLPVISNQKFNSFLKEIAEIVGIDKNLTHHIARKTFATTVLLYNNVPMEIVSELLGHSNMNITQSHYGKIVQKKVSDEMKNLDLKLSKKKGIKL